MAFFHEVGSRRAAAAASERGNFIGDIVIGNFVYGYFLITNLKGSDNCFRIRGMINEYPGGPGYITGINLI
jgi:hypothetical protein